MTVHQSLRTDRDDLCGSKPQAGPKVPTATPEQRQETREWAQGGMAEYIRNRWKNWQVEEDTASTGPQEIPSVHRP